MSVEKLLNKDTDLIYDKLNEIFLGKDVEDVFAALSIYMVSYLEYIYAGNKTHVLNTIELFHDLLKTTANHKKIKANLS